MPLLLRASRRGRRRKRGRVDLARHVVGAFADIAQHLSAFPVISAPSAPDGSKSATKSPLWFSFATKADAIIDPIPSADINHEMMHAGDCNLDSDIIF